jgi:oxygen-independent coproporphyrinogen-3 oxidase
LPLSLYVHIPFCESLCYYCACNKIITKHHDRADAYLRYLSREVDLHTAPLGMGQVVSQLHLGAEHLRSLGRSQLAAADGHAAAQLHFGAGRRIFDRGGSHARSTPDRLAVLAELGFNRLSFGVQDFDAEVQKAVHRVQPAEQVFALVAKRGAGL